MISYITFVTCEFYVCIDASSAIQQCTFASLVNTYLSIYLFRVHGQLERKGVKQVLMELEVGIQIIYYCYFQQNVYSQ